MDSYIYNLSFFSSNIKNSQVKNMIKTLAKDTPVSTKKRLLTLNLNYAWDSYTGAMFDSNNSSRKREFVEKVLKENGFTKTKLYVMDQYNKVE